MRDAPRDLGGVLWRLNESDVAGAGEFDEAVERVGCTVHPVQRARRTTEHLGPERELALHVARRDGEVVHALGVERCGG